MSTPSGDSVRDEIRENALVVGNPARQMGWMSEYGHRLNFDKTGIATCPENGEKYRLENGKVAKLPIHTEGGKMSV